jgi:cobalamin biosynthesis protein CobT
MMDTTSAIGSRMAGREEALMMPILKAFGERMTSRVASRFVAYPREGVLGNTIIGEVVQIAHDELIRQPQRGKVMIVLTDGSPGAYGDQDWRGHAKQVVSNIEKNSPFGIGIQIQTDWLFSNSADINSVSELPALLMQKLTATVLSKIHK